MTDLTVASLNIRGIPLTGSRLAARCAAIGAFFEATDADVVCLQEVATHAHLAVLEGPPAYVPAHCLCSGCLGRQPAGRP